MDVTIDTWCNCQNSLLESLQKCLTNYKKDSETRKTRSYFQQRIEKVRAICKEFRENDREIRLKGVPKDHSYVKKDTPEAFEEVYLQVMCQFEEDRDAKFPPEIIHQTLDSSLVNSSIDLGRQVRLQKLNVPEFNGVYTEWPTYRDMFVNLVHSNKQISNIERFFHLKYSLKGEPYDMIKHLLVTDANYNTAWEMLKSHYENPRELFKATMNMLYNHAKIEKEDAQSIRALLSVSRECRQALRNFQLELEHCDPLLVFFISKKLPSETIGLWETKIGGSTSLSTFKELETFLDTRVKTLDAIADSEGARSGVSTGAIPKNKNYSNTQVKSTKNYHATVQEKNNITCYLCGDNHVVRKCERFLSSSLVDRRQAIEGKGLCMNCLAATHVTNACKSKFNCATCGDRHHTLLHQAKGPSFDLPSPNVSTPTQIQSHIANVKTKKVLLATALVRVQNSVGNFVTLRAMIDSGSEATLISDSVVKWLGLSKRSVHTLITGVGDVRLDPCKHVVDFSLRSNVNDFQLYLTGFILPKLSGFLPSKPVEFNGWPHIEGLTLADPDFHRPAAIDIILGADAYSQILVEGLKKAKDLPTAQNTELGWVLVGTVDDDTTGPIEQMRSHVARIQMINPQVLPQTVCDYFQEFMQLSRLFFRCYAKLATLIQLRDPGSGCLLSIPSLFSIKDFFKLLYLKLCATLHYLKVLTYTELYAPSFDYPISPLSIHTLVFENFLCPKEVILVVKGTKSTAFIHGDAELVKSTRGHEGRRKGQRRSTIACRKAQPRSNVMVSTEKDD